MLSIPLYLKKPYAPESQDSIITEKKLKLRTSTPASNMCMPKVIPSIEIPVHYWKNDYD